jgi:hypothetical protein
MVGQHACGGIFSKYFRHTYVAQSFVMCLKEFVAVLVQLVCYSRLGSVDLINGGVILYMILVVFSFPFLNSYLYGFLRFGMWWNNRLKSRTGGWIIQTVIQFICMTLCQVGGALLAAWIVKQYSGSWGDAVLRSVSDPVDGGAVGVQYESSASGVGGFMFLEEFCAVFILLVGLLHLMHCFNDDLLKNTYWAKPEPVDTTTVVVAETGGPIIVDAAEKPFDEEDFDPDEFRVARGDGFTDKLEIIRKAISAIASNVHEVSDTCKELSTLAHSSAAKGGVSGVAVIPANDLSDSVEKRRPANGRLPPLPSSQSVQYADLPPAHRGLDGLYFPNLNIGSFFMGAAVSPALSTAVQPAEYIKLHSFPIAKIPGELILHASFLVMAISRAFPSAHQSLHITVYLRGRDIIKEDEMLERFVGGYLACIFALGYYWFWYVYAGDAKGDKNGRTTRLIRRNFMDPLPPFLRDKLKVPQYMRMEGSML